MSSASGPSQRKISVSSLVYSTLGPSLGLLPQEEKGDWVVIEEKKAASNANGSSAQLNGDTADDVIDVDSSRPRPQQHSIDSSTVNVAGGETRYDVEPKQSKGSQGNVFLNRLYSEPASRLNFNSKSSAGSISTKTQATLPKQTSLCEESTSSPVSKQLQSHISKIPMAESTTSTPSTSGEVWGVPRSASTGASMIPRPPTGSEWSRSNKSDEPVSISSFLHDLDKQAGEKERVSRVSSLQNDTQIGCPISWNEDAISNRHIWEKIDTREACYLADTQYCQQLKVFHPRRQKLKCSACKTVVHETCIKQLYYEGYCCKETFREIKQKVKEISTYHHFMQRRKASGRCKKCEKGFGSWKKFNLRDVVGVSCSWCGDSYHVSCFNEGLKKDQCHMGPLRNLIIPPSWIVKVPPIEQLSSGASYSGNSEAHISPKGSARRRTRRSRRKKNDEKASKYFTVKPMASRQHKPLLVFINRKSGGGQGVRLMRTFQWLLNPRQVFDLGQGGPEFGLKLFQGVSNIRILACGGDGTAGWIFSILDKLDIRPPPPMAILPLGTGNDLARVYGWGAGYSDEPIEKILLHVDEGPVEEMDRWQLSVWENPDPKAVKDSEGKEDTPLHVINNYFSIGADAQVALEFHEEREANPERFTSRYRNKFVYTKLGGKDLFLRRFQTLTDHIKLYGDGEDLTEKIRNLQLEAVCFLNITSYGAGTNAWGNPSARDPVFKPQMMDDGKIEIVGFYASTFPKLHVGLAHGERIAQCMHIKLVTYKTLPVQIDGEACKLQPSVIEVGLKNKAMLVRKVPRSHPEAPLQGVRPSDRIKLSVSRVTIDQYDRLHSDLYEIRRAAKALGLVVATAQDTLQTMRKQINQFANELDEDREPQLSKNWRFLDVANSGRVDRMFQVIPDQERTIVIGDMLSDGLLIVELPPSPPPTPISGVSAPSPSILLSLETQGGEHPLTTASEKRRLFGRNASYESATNQPSNLKGMSPPRVQSDSAKDGLEVPANPNLPDSSPTDTPVHSDDELCSLMAPLPKLTDTGSDSTGTDTDVIPPHGAQKAFLDSVKRGNLKKVIDYHNKGAHLTATDNNGWTPLHHAARLDKKDVVQYIIAHIPREALDIVEDEKLQTPLHKAAWYGHIEVCKLLVGKGASLTRRDYQGNDVYDKSVQSGSKELQGYIKFHMDESKKLHTNEMAI